MVSCRTLACHEQERSEETNAFGGKPEKWDHRNTRAGCAPSISDDEDKSPCCRARRRIHRVEPTVHGSRASVLRRQNRQVVGRQG